MLDSILISSSPSSILKGVPDKWILSYTILHVSIQLGNSYTPFYLNSDIIVPFLMEDVSSLKI